MVDVSRWLAEQGLGHHAEAFAKNGIAGDIVRELTDADLKELGLNLGDRKRLLKEIAALDAAPRLDRAEAAEPTTPAVPREAERRQLTVIFVDLVGSTALSATLDPEDMRKVIRAYQNAVAGEIVRFEGHVAKFMGDGVLAYFGWPRAHEDEAERAVRAGLALAQTVGQLKAPTGEALSARVGIATGLVVVGDLVGEGASQEQAVVGDTPNLAARLQGIAAPGQVVIADVTRRLLGASFELESLGARALKGISAPTRAFAVIGERPVESRFEAMSGPSVLPMVGRDQELALLLERWAQAKAGEGQGVLLSGEAGIGKSRISRALLDVLAKEPHTRIRYQCSPYHVDSALWPVIQQLTQAAGIKADDPVESKLDRLEVLLGRVRRGAADVAPLIADLIGLEGGARYGTLDLTPQMRRARTLEALVDQLLGLAAQQPVLMVLEDAHWIDPTTLELVAQCLDRITDSRVLLLLTSRPDHQPALAAHPHVTRLTLNRLGRVGVEAIVTSLSARAALATDVIDAIIARTDGVPLFVEELTKAILETGETSIPASLHDSLMARLDRIPEVKEVAQIAACIGREFDYLLLSAVVDRTEPSLQSDLDRLAAAELVFRRGMPPEAVYRFKHALVQDAAYHSLLRSRRRELHARIGDALEKGFPEVAKRRPDLLAHHHACADRSARAIKLWIAAANRALAVAADREAVAFLERALGALGEQEDTPQTLGAMIDVRRILHQAFYRVGELRQTRANLAEAKRLAERLADPVRLCRIMSSETYLLATIGELADAVEIGERALAMLDHAGDDLEGAVSTRLMLARALYASGRYREAVGHIRPVIEMLGEDVPREQLGPGVHQGVSARLWLLLCLAELGEFAEGAALAAEAQRLSAQSEGPWQYEEKVWMQVAAGRCAVLQDDFAGAVETLEPVLTICENEFVIHFSRAASSLGIAHARSGRVERGVALLRQAVSQAEAIGFRFCFGLLLAQLGEALLLADDADGALDAGKRALDAARGSGEEAGEGWALLLLGDVAARCDRTVAAARYREALDIAERLYMAPLRQHCLKALAA